MNTLYIRIFRPYVFIAIVDDERILSTPGTRKRRSLQLGGDITC